MIDDSQLFAVCPGADSQRMYKHSSVASSWGKNSSLEAALILYWPFASCNPIDSFSSCSE